MRFQDIPGPKDLSLALAESIDQSRVPHAQLFISNDGGAGLMTALAYSQYLNCENVANGDSCGQCFSCIKIQKFIHPDVHYCFPFAKTDLVKEDELAGYMPLFRSFLAESPYGTIKEWAAKAHFENRTPLIPVRAVRETILGLTLKAYEARYKVQIIWMPETMNVAGANAILKLLEEPPPFTVFLLVCPQPELLLPTIISRTQMVVIPKLKMTDVAEYLQKSDGVSVSRSLAIASLAEGSIAVAMELLDEKEDDFHQLFLEWERACFSNKIDKLLEFTDSFQTMGKELQKTFLKYCLGKLRSAMALKFEAAQTVHLPDNELTDLGKMGAIFSISLFEQQMHKLEEAYFHIDRNASARMVFFDTSLQIAQSFQIEKHRKLTSA